MADTTTPGHGRDETGHEPHHIRGDDVVLVQARASGRTIREAAELAGLSERQARRRLREPELRRAVERLRAERRAAVLAGLEALAPAALDRLTRLLDADQASVQLQAVKTILGIAVPMKP